MPRSNRTQWDFGELFPAASTKPTWSVTELTARVRDHLERSFGQVWVHGEISNFRCQSSGHSYFVLKDAGAQLSCVLFRSQPGIPREAIRDGARVLLGGALTVYEARGQYQLRVTSVELQGIGALQAAFERLKQKLSAEGLFDAARKRPLPAYPMRIGLVTSPTGAALRDVLHVVEGRHQGLQFLLAGCRVQGDGAADEIACAIALLNRWDQEARTRLEPGIDLLLVTRGGGSLEDLWAFNEEVVARAIAASSLPVLSAVGHEIDFTIADFVADARAATPSAAAALVTENWVTSREFVLEASTRLGWLVNRRFLAFGEIVQEKLRRVGRLHPRRRLEAASQLHDELIVMLGRTARNQFRRATDRWRAAIAGLSTSRLRNRVVMARQGSTDASRRLRDIVRARLDLAAHRLERAWSRLQLLSPQNVLKRGYSITFDAESQLVVHDVSQIEVGRRIISRFGSGQATSRVESTQSSDGDAK